MNGLLAYNAASPPGARRLAPALVLAAAAVLLTAQLPMGSLPVQLPSALAGAGGADRTQQQASEAYAQLPLSFVANAGQTDPDVRYAAQAGGASFWFTSTEAVFSFARQDDGVNLRLGFLGANPAPDIVGTDALAGRVNYILGDDPSAWQTNLPTYGELAYRDLWPGIDLAFRGEAGTLKYEFRVAPGADPSAIRLAYRGAESLALGSAGDLLLSTALGTISDAAPVTHQIVGGQRVPVESGYQLAGAAYGFELGAYDRSRALVIDPGLLYSTFLGGSGFDNGGRGIAVDGLGNAYVTGQTASADFPTTPGAFDTTYNGGVNDAFVTKLDPSGAALLYSTFLGGSGSDDGRGIAVDGDGNAYVTGQTASADFPTTPGAFDTTRDGGSDAFVTKLDPSGAALAYSTFLGGSGFDDGRGIAVDGDGNAYVTGLTASADFPTTAGAFDTTRNGNSDAFVTKLDASGTALAYSTYLGGGGSDAGNGIAVDAFGSAYLTGLTASADFPTTTGAFDTTKNTVTDAFVTKLDASGSALHYSTFLGGDGFGQGIAVDAAGSAYVTGVTSSADFPTTTGAFDTTHDGGTDAFVTKLDASGSALLYSTFLGGSGFDAGQGIAVDAAGSAYVTGQTGSTDFPTTPGAFDTTLDGSDAFVTKLDLVPFLLPATLTLSPVTATNPVGTDHTVTATVQDASSNPVPDVIVRFSVTGSVTTSGDCTTDASGQCDFTYTGPSLPGADLISAYADTDEDNTQDPGEPSGAATKAWELPASTAGQASGGGHFADAAWGKVVFGFVAKSQDGAFHGRCNVIDPGNRMIKCLDVTALVISGNQATIYGNATDDGVATTYVIKVADNADPGKGADTFSITTASGFSASGTLTAGNIQVKP